jgi:hypothetical protein
MGVSPKANWLELVVISSLFLVLSVWGIIWDFTSGLLASGIDGIMFAAVCLLMALIFGGMLFFQLREGGILPSFAHKQKTAAAALTSAKAAALAAQPASSQAKSAQPRTTAVVK